jgi:hypothetical protein
MEKWLHKKTGRLWWTSALLIAALYGGTITFGLTYDDLLLIKSWPLHELMSKWTEPWSERFYRPLINFFFTGEHLLFGAATWGYHLVNLLLATVIVSLYQLILRAFKVKPVPALLCALLWMALPGNGAIITWISAQIDLFALVFMLAAFRLFMRAVEARGRRAGYLAFSLIMAGLAYCCKEISVTLPLLIAAWLIIMKPLPRRQALVLTLPHFILWLGYFIWRALLLGARTVGERGFSENAWVAARPLAGLAGMAGRYVEALISTLYPVFLMPSWLTALLMLALISLLASMVWKKHSALRVFGRETLLLLVFAAIAALPNMLDASPRLLGVPTLAAAAILVLALARLLAVLPRRRPQLVLLAALLLFSYLHINGQVQACFTQPVYLSTLQYDVNDRRRWPFSDLHNVRYQIRETLLRIVQ